MSTPSTAFDFDLLDDLALGVERGLVRSDTLPPLHAEMMGPLLEVVSIARVWQDQQISNLNWLHKHKFDALFEDVTTLRKTTQNTGIPLGWIVGDQFADNTPWTGFLMRVSAAIKNQGYDKRTKQAVMATFGEFRSNVIEHAVDYSSAIAAFNASLNDFEIVVSDTGRGVLESIKENPNYHDLTDNGEALSLVVTDGISRHNDPGRGHGFTHLFDGLSNRFNHIRLRSGDHALEVHRENADQPMSRISEKASIKGFYAYARISRV